MELKAYARLQEVAASLNGLAQLADKAAAEAVKGKKGPTWAKTLFKAKLKRLPTEEELEALGFEVFNYDEDAKPVFALEWRFADGMVAACFQNEDVFLELKKWDIDDIEGNTEKYHNDLEKTVNALIKKFG